jgi:ABC-type transport system involved in Fe-S cluster assembly fused permease/ATPase subunit
MIRLFVTFFYVYQCYMSIHTKRTSGFFNKAIEKYKKSLAFFTDILKLNALNVLAEESTSPDF